MDEQYRIIRGRHSCEVAGDDDIVRTDLPMNDVQSLEHYPLGLFHSGSGRRFLAKADAYVELSRRHPVRHIGQRCILDRVGHGGKQLAKIVDNRRQQFLQGRIHRDNGNMTGSLAFHCVELCAHRMETIQCFADMLEQTFAGGRELQPAWQPVE